MKRINLLRTISLGIFPVNLLSREAVSNRADSRDGMTNTAEVPPIMDDGWMKVAPYGDFNGSLPGRLQHFHLKQAEAMVSEFNSVKGRLGRMFRGRSIYVGHPDADPQNYPDERRLGKIMELEARADGLWALPEWNTRGKENVDEGYWVYPSPYWDAPGGQSQFKPDRLISIGLTNNPRIAVSEPATNAKQPDNNNDIMDRQALIQKLGLDPEATDEEILAKIDSIMNAAQSDEDVKVAEEMQNSLTTITTARDAATNSLNTANGRVTALETELQTARTAHANTLIDAAMVDTRIEKSQREQWEKDFGADFETASNSLAGRKPSLNTQQINLQKSREDVSNARSRREKIANAVRDEQAKGRSYSEAYASVKANPDFAALFAAMQEPQAAE